MNETILIFIVVIGVYLFLYLNNKSLVYVEVEGFRFSIQDNEDKDKSKKLLGEMVKRMYQLRDYLNSNKNKFPEYQQYIDLLIKNFNKDRTHIYENDHNSSHTSYSVNKGQELVFCLKSKNENKYHNINLLMYVAIHEMAHLACPEIGHTPLFNKVFKFLAEQSVNIGIYIKNNYEYAPVEYCGMILSSNIL